ncbi:MAG TPA: OmpA family protein [Myxococcales bacterium]|nr:OmpA family protein [Myxococcales bacterium]
MLGALLSLAVAMQPLEVQLVGQVLAGKRPQVIVLAHVAARDVRLDLTRSGCAAGEVHLAVARVGAGRSTRFELDQPLGRCSYEGTLAARLGGQEASMPLSFTAEIAAPPKVEAAPDALDASAHVVRVTFNRQADHGVVAAWGEDGQLLGRKETKLGGTPPGEILSLDYPAGGGAPLKLEVQVYDDQGLFGGVALYPWSLRIPHQEVEFPSGSAEIPAGEAGKLADSASRILATLRRVGGQAPLRLFVVGYTDTVGSRESNQALSEARARSIGAWFRAHGVRVPVLTGGLGEDALAVATADETAEARNRRAEYILAVDAPAIDNAPHQPDWRTLP